MVPGAVAQGALAAWAAWAWALALALAAGVGGLVALCGAAALRQPVSGGPAGQGAPLPLPLPLPLTRRGRVHQA